MESESKRRFEQLGLLLDIGKSIVSHLNLRELIGVICRGNQHERNTGQL